MIQAIPTTPEGSLVSRYEALRGGALGQPIGPDARAGLTVLLRSGVWAWARAMTTESSPMRTPPRSTDPVPHVRPGDLVRLLADMTLASVRRTS
jgi:hypothetical protein